MNVSENELRFMKKLASQGEGVNDIFEVAGLTDADREAFSNLKPRGLVRGYSTKDGVTACLSENGKQALCESQPMNVLWSWLLKKADLLFDQTLSHAASLVLGVVLGWVAKAWLG